MNRGENKRRKVRYINKAKGKAKLKAKLRRNGKGWRVQVYNRQRI